MTERRKPQAASRKPQAASRKPQRNIGEQFIGWKPRVDKNILIPDLRLVSLNKEEAEEKYANIFVNEFNKKLPFGLGLYVKIIKQNDTSSLDFSIESPLAKYLELAEFTPLGEGWSKDLRLGHSVPVPKMALWIWDNIVVEKSSKYGPALCGDTILLIYPTHGEFSSLDLVIEMLRSLFAYRATTNRFKSVFYIDLLGDKIFNFKQLYPVVGSVQPLHYFSGSKTRIIPNSWLKKDPDTETITIGKTLAHE